MIIKHILDQWLIILLLKTTLCSHKQLLKDNNKLQPLIQLKQAIRTKQIRKHDMF